MVTVQGNRVEFRFLRPQARDVYVAGDFNRWKRGQLGMDSEPGGWWRLVLHLPPGAYRFRYCADGQWFIDHAAFGIRHGPHGPDSIVEVPEQAGPPRRGADRRPMARATSAPRR